MPLNALLLSKDSDLMPALSAVLHSLEITVEHCSEPFAAAKRLMDHHFDLVFVDCDDQQGAAWVLQSARMASRNKGALTVAVMGENAKVHPGKLNENFVVNKPIQAKQAESTLRVAKNLVMKNQAGSAKPTSPAPSVLASASGAMMAPPKPQEQVATPHASASTWSDDALDALEALGDDPTPAPILSPSLPQPTELMAKKEEAVPGPSAHATAAHGSAAAAAPAREAPAVSRPEPQPQPEIKHASSGPRDPEPAPTPRTALLPPVSKAAAGAPSSTRIAPVNSPVVAAPQAAQAEAPAVQPLAPDAPAEPEFRSTLLDSASPAVGPNRRLAVAVGIVVLIAGVLAFSFSRMRHHSSAQVQPEVSAPQPAVAASAPQSTAGSAQESAVNASHPGKAAAVSSPASESSSPGNKKSGHEKASTKSAEAEPVVEAEQAAIRMPGAVKQPAPQEEEAVAPPTGVVEPGSAPNLGHVVAAVPSAMPAPVPAQRVKVSEGVSQGLLIRQVKPAYPSLARDSHVTGAVRLRAIIGKDGAVHGLALLGGHPLLAKSAMDAVWQWKYKPYLLNGQPVEVQTEITVVFKM